MHVSTILSGQRRVPYATMPVTNTSLLPLQHRSLSSYRPSFFNCQRWSNINTEATPEFAITWIWLRDPSPPEAPVADWVSFALMSCLTYTLLVTVQFKEYMYRTFVTELPARKKTASSARKTLQGCTAWMTAVTNAVTMPTGVSDFRECAL
jgi:hypothetical protein